MAHLTPPPAAAAILAHGQGSIVVSGAHGSRMTLIFNTRGDQGRPRVSLRPVSLERQETDFRGSPVLARFAVTFGTDAILMLGVTIVPQTPPARSGAYAIVIREATEPSSPEIVAASVSTDRRSVSTRGAFGTRFVANRTYVIDLIANDPLERLPKTAPPVQTRV